MASLNEVEKNRQKAYDQYTTLKTKLLSKQGDLDAYTSTAQAANEAWLYFKKLDAEFNNLSILQKMGDLYGC